MANQRLEFEKDRVSDNTLARWKKYEFTSEKDQELAEEFRDLYERAMIQQKQALFERMAAKDEKRSWNRWMSIIERKFDDWNLRHKQVDETPDRKQLVFRVAPEGGKSQSKDEEKESG